MKSNKIKLASELDISQMPNVFRVIQRDIKKIDFNNVQDYSQKYGNIYFNEDYNVNLYGWSGLEKFYNNLKKIQQLKNHDDIAIINRVVLDPTLCLRVLSSQQAKQFWQKDFKYQTTIGKPFMISVVVCDTVVNNAQGFYSQSDEVFMIQKSDVNTMMNILVHQFVHVLDHITAIALKQNCNKLVQNYGFAPNKGNGKDDSHLFKTPNDKGKDVDLHDIDNESKQQYFASFAQYVNVLEKNIIEDIGYYSKDFNVNIDLSNIMFCYITGYNILKNTLLDQNKLLSKLKSMQQQNSASLYYDLFEYIINNNTNIINDLEDVKNANRYDYIGIIKDMYQKIKHDSYLGDLNLIQKQILQSL